jgi:prepilin-type N-terminal cleavage/methylation domain-containing protein
MTSYTSARSEGGFSLVETMLAITLFSVVSLGFYQVVFGQARGTQVTRTGVRIGEEARAGFNRMVRDAREGDVLDAASGNSFTVKVNFNGNGLYENPNAQGADEILTYTYDETSKTITLNGEVLMSGVERIGGQHVFSYGSNVLDYDWDDSGSVTWQEVNDAACAGNGVTGVGDCDVPPVLDAPEFPHLTTVSFALRIKVEGQHTDFRTTAQLRNRL